MTLGAWGTPQRSQTPLWSRILYQDDCQTNLRRYSLDLLRLTLTRQTLLYGSEILKNADIRRLKNARPSHLIRSQLTYNLDR